MCQFVAFRRAIGSRPLDQEECPPCWKTHFRGRLSSIANPKAIMCGLLLVGHQFDWLPLPPQNSWETWSMFFQLVKFLVMLWKQKAAQCCSHSSTESVRSTIHRNGRFHSGHASVWGISYWLLLVTMQVRQRM